MTSDFLDYFPSEDVLKKGLYSKYHFNSKLKKTSQRTTNILYRYQELNEDGEIIEKRYTTGFNLTSQRKYKIEDKLVKVEEVQFFHPTDSVGTTLIQNGYLDLSGQKTNLSIEREYADYGLTVLNEYERELNSDTLWMDKPAVKFNTKTKSTRTREEEQTEVAASGFMIFADGMGMVLHA